MTFNISPWILSQKLRLIPRNSEVDFLTAPFLPSFPLIKSLCFCFSPPTLVPFLYAALNAVITSILGGWDWVSSLLFPAAANRLSRNPLELE